MREQNSLRYQIVNSPYRDDFEQIRRLKLVNDSCRYSYTRLLVMVAQGCLERMLTALALNLYAYNQSLTSSLWYFNPSGVFLRREEEERRRNPHTSHHSDFRIRISTPITEKGDYKFKLKVTEKESWRKKTIVGLTNSNQLFFYENKTLIVVHNSHTTFRHKCALVKIIILESLSSICSHKYR